jgi:hypothetical protein
VYVHTIDAQVAIAEGIDAEAQLVQDCSQIYCLLGTRIQVYDNKINSSNLIN